MITSWFQKQRRHSWATNRLRLESWGSSCCSTTFQHFLEKISDMIGSDLQRLRDGVGFSYRPSMIQFWTPILPSGPIVIMSLLLSYHHFFTSNSWENPYNWAYIISTKLLQKVDNALRHASAPDICQNTKCANLWLGQCISEILKVDIHLKESSREFQNFTKK